MQIIETKGNQVLMNREKTLFLCSKRTPINLYEYIFRWTDSLSEYITDFIPTDGPKQQKAYTMEEKRIKHPNAYCLWTKEDDTKLLQLSVLGKSISELCEIFGRNEGVIISRLKKLN